jgi:hypothetical protein
LHRLGGIRNANRVLKDMDDYLSSFRLGEKVYYLNQEGRLRANSEKVCKKTPQANHYIMRNWLFIALGCPAEWKNEIKFSNGQVSVIADAMYKRKDQYHIVEVDYSQKMHENKLKIFKYRQLKEQGAFLIAPKFYWITTTPHRKKQILALSEGLDTTVYLTSDFN